MNILSGVSDFFGLDLGAISIRAVQLRGLGDSKSLIHYGHTPIEVRASQSESQMDKQKIVAAIQQVVKESGITTTNVAVNLPSTKVFTTVVDMDRLPQSDLAKTIAYQASSYIPTDIAKSKIDWAVIGDSPVDPKKKVEVLLSSVPNDFIESRLDLLEAAGLNVIAFEPDSMALVRALTPPEATTPQMVLDMGSVATDLVVVINGIPRLTRAIPTGTQQIIRAASQALGIDAAQAEQMVFKFGLSKDKMEGRIYNAVLGSVEGLVMEIEKSIKFFQGRYTTMKIDRLVVTGGASVMPEFPLYIANKFNINVEIGNAWHNVSYPADRQNELLALSNHFAIAAGLAERNL